MTVARVIEARGLPLLGAVAIVAGITETTTVHIVDRVTATAISRRIFVIGTAMTLRACSFFMRSGQCKMRLAVIKRSLAPQLLGMASLAFITLTTLVHIITAMAIDTFTGRVPQWFVVSVTLITCQRNVPAFEWKIREIVYEGVSVELQNIGIPALMLGMTQLALRGFYARLAAVKAGARTNICCHLLMTGETQIVQLLVSFPRMALRAVTFEFCV